jgi:enoyl-CoA hydratase/carnithine racemase
MSDLVKVTDKDGVRTIRMSRADKKNALNIEMYAALAKAVADGHLQRDVRCLLIAGVPGAFCAGNDLKDFQDAAKAGIGLGDQAVDFLHALASCEKPIVAAVQGVAVGIGTTMLLHCDLVVLAENALLSTPFVSLALVPEAASSMLMPLRIGYARAFEMFALGEVVDAKSALAWGIANRVVPLDKLDAEARAFASRLARQPAGAVSAAKRLMRNPDVLMAQIKAESEQFAARLKTAEAREAFTAFAERRPPDFLKLAAS